MWHAFGFMSVLLCQKTGQNVLSRTLYKNHNRFTEYKMAWLLTFKRRDGESETVKREGNWRRWPT